MKRNVVFGVLVLAIVVGAVAYRGGEIGAGEKNTSAGKSVSYKVSTYLGGYERAKSAGVDTISSVEPTAELAFEKADTIAVVKVVSVDGVEYSENHFFPITYGKILVNNVISGNASVGDVLDFKRSGGVVPIEQFYDAEPQEAKAKREYLKANNFGESSGDDEEFDYVETLGDGDINIEAGKTYLVYLHILDDGASYGIVGQQAGLREVNIAQSTENVSVESLDLNNLSVKDNSTGGWVQLSSITMIGELLN